MEPDHSALGLAREAKGLVDALDRLQGERNVHVGNELDELKDRCKALETKFWALAGGVIATLVSLLLKLLFH